MLINRRLSLVFNIEKILADCLAGKSEAFEKIYTHFSGRMYGICLRYSNCAEDAQDILQEGWIKVFQKLKQFNNIGSFEGWIRKIMVNTALEKYRSSSKIVLVREDALIFEESENEDVIANISADDLLNLVQELTPQYRLVFNLYAIEGYTHKEISTMLEITEGTSKSNLSRARQFLQKKVQEFYLIEKQVI